MDLKVKCPSRFVFQAPGVAILRTAVLILASVSFHSSLALASPSSATGDLVISGVVPEVMSASAEIFKETLAFKSREQVRNRVIGKVRMKYNVPLSAIELSSNRPAGIPSNDLNVRYPFGQFGFVVKLGPCVGIDPAASNPIQFPSTERQPVSIGSAPRLNSGVDASCDLLGSWDGAETDPVETGVSYSVDYSISLSPAG